MTQSITELSAIIISLAWHDFSHNFSLECSTETPSPTKSMTTTTILTESPTLFRLCWNPTCPSTLEEARRRHQRPPTQSKEPDANHPPTRTTVGPVEDMEKPRYHKSQGAGVTEQSQAQIRNQETKWYDGWMDLDFILKIINFLLKSNTIPTGVLPYLPHKCFHFRGVVFVCIIICLMRKQYIGCQTAIWYNARTKL